MLRHLSMMAQDGIVHGVQLFLSRELWAFDNAVLDYHGVSNNRARGIPTLAAERVFARCLPLYLKFMEERLGVSPPYRIEAGAEPVKTFRLYIDEDNSPTILQDLVVHQETLNSRDPASVDQALLRIFEAFFDAAGVSRPSGLYLFPGATPGGMPRQ